MKKTGYIAFGAIMAALSTAIMLMSYFPYLTYSIPALAGMFIMVAVIELGIKWAMLSFVSSAFIVLLTAEPEAAFIYVCLFGIYPIAKALIEKVPNTFLKYVIKLLLFNAAVLIVYFAFMKLLGVNTGLEGMASYLIAAVWLFANVVFLIYDFAILRVSEWYMYRFHTKVSRLIRK